MRWACAERGARGALLAATLAAGPACTETFRAPPVPSRPLASAAPLRAGVAAVDITPAPGLALFGHGPEGRVSRGILSRLRCHAFVLSEGPEAVALVPCELAAPSLLLSRRIAIALRERHPDVLLGSDRIVLGATHTHAGPAHFFGAGNYAGPLSTRSPQGTSEAVLSRLAEQIAGAIAEAWSARRPARLGWHHAEVWGLTKNRSLEAFARNAPADGATRGDDDGFVAAALSAHRPAQAAVDPSLSVLRIDEAREGGEPLGALAVFGVHPTGVSNLNDLYHGDLFGAASRAVFDEEQDPLCGARCPPVAFLSGVSGDVSPVLDAQGPREARRWASDLAGFVREAWEAAGAHLSTEAGLRVAYRELRLPAAAAAPLAEVLGPADDAGRRRVPAWVTACACEGPRACGQPPPLAVAGQTSCACLCDHAAVGAAASGGAEDGPTAFRFIDGFREGARLERRACHAPKIEIGGLGACEASFPHHVPIWSVRVGGALVATFPAEVTTMAGRRATRAIDAQLAVRAADLPSARLRVVPVTLVGDWLQYVATEEEYAAQPYEGASTLWGPATARFFARQAGCLAAFVVDPSGARDQTCRLGQPAPFESFDVAFEAPPARLSPAPAACGHDGEAALCAAPGASGARGGPCSRRPTPATRDGELGVQMTFLPPPPCATERHVPRASVVDARGDRVDDDEGMSFELRAFPHGIGGRVDAGGLALDPPAWLVSWFPDARTRDRACARGPLRLRVSLARASGPGEAPRAPLAAESDPFDPCVAP